MTDLKAVDISSIAQRANEIKKPKKEEVQNLVLELVSAGAIDKEQAAILYKFFQPQIGKIKSYKDWLSKALPKAHKIAGLCYILSRDNDVLVSNGHLVLSADKKLIDEDIENGFYNKNFHRIEIDPSYPDFAIDNMFSSEVNPTTEEFEYDNSKLETFWLESNYGIYKNGKAKHLYQLPSGDFVDKKLWDLATAFNPEGVYEIVDKQLNAGRESRIDGRFFRLIFDDGSKAIVAGHVAPK